MDVSQFQRVSKCVGSHALLSCVSCVRNGGLARQTCWAHISVVKPFLETRFASPRTTQAADRIATADTQFARLRKAQRAPGEHHAADRSLRVVGCRFLSKESWCEVL